MTSGPHPKFSDNESVSGAAELEAERGAKIQDTNQSFADPEAQMMQTGDGALTHAYEAQAAVSEDGLIAATGLTTAVRDTGQARRGRGVHRGAPGHAARG